MRTMSRCTVYAKEFLSQINTRDPTRSEELFPKKLWNRNRNRCVENRYASGYRCAETTSRPRVAGAPAESVYEGIGTGDSIKTAFSIQCGG